jgi:Uma2 family endonuclease
MERGDMQAEVSTKNFTVDDYYRMAEVGIIGPEDRVELIDGQIVQMSPPGIRHIAATHRATTLFTEALGRRVIVSVQNPLRLDRFNEPQPDIIILKPQPDFYASRNSGPEDASLVIEISETSLSYDRNLKLPHYAAKRIAEVWIENLKDDVLHVYRDPARRTYKTNLTLHRGETVSPLAFSDVVLKVDDLLP